MKSLVLVALDKVKDKLADEKDKLADEYVDEAVAYIQSEKFQKKIADKINEKIDIPFVSEEKEQIFFERVVDICTDIVASVVRK